MNVPELSLVVLVGVSGSGKSTFARTHFKPTEVISSDFCRGLVADDENDQSATPAAFEVLRFIAGKRLAAGRLTVVDATNVQPEARRELVALAREPKRLGLILLGCAGTTLGAAIALWASVQAFGGNVTFVAVTVVTMVGGTLASAAPTPGGVGAVEAALIGGLAAFGVPAAVAVPSVLLYRVLTCWIPVFVGWPVMRWLTDKDLI